MAPNWSDRSQTWTVKTKFDESETRFLNLHGLLKFNKNLLGAQVIKLN